MSLLTFELLDARTEVARWVERQLTGEDLTSVVAELLGWRVGSNDSESLEKVFGNHLPEILESGLLESDAQMLLRYPRLMLELQEQICVRGGLYWYNLGVHGRTDRSSGTGDIIPPNLSRMLGFLERQTPTSSAPVRQKSAPVKTPPASNSNDRSDRPAIVATAVKPTQRRQTLSNRSIAALALIFLAGFGVLLFNQNLGINVVGPGQNVAIKNGKPISGVPQTNKWGFNDLKPLQEIKDGPAYMNAVARAMNDWVDQPPSDSAQGAQRIQELIDGCQNLIAAEQLDRSPLAAGDREWLHEKCTKWIGKFRADLVALNADPAAWPEVSKSMNGTIEKAVDLMRNQAEKIGKSAAV